MSVLYKCGACGKVDEASEAAVENTKKPGFLPEIFCSTECCVTYLSRIEGRKMRVEYVH